MNTNTVPSSLSSTTSSAASSSRAEDRARIAELAAEFESLLLVNVLRDMRSSGRWTAEETGDSLGAQTFDQTIDVELSRYLSKAGGFGLSQRLLSAFDALARIADTGPETASREIANDPPATGDVTSAAPATATRTASTAGNATSGRTGWSGMRLDAPSYGGSGAEWAGFNNDRALAGGDDSSVKDAFFRWTYGSSFNPAGKSKEEIASFLRDNIDSAREYGLNILDIQGEQILIETEERGAEWVDVVGSAGGPGARWQWLCQTEFGVVGGGALGDAIASLRSAPDGDARVRAVLTSTSMTGEGLLASIRAEVTAAASGGTFVTPRVTESVPAAPEELRTVTSNVTSAFGWRQDPFSGATTFHSGVDVSGAEGDPVASAGAGRVLFSGSDGGYGTSVVVQHANGLTTRYAHLSAALVSAGEQVEDGQLVGLVGQTGRATGPHLHYEVRVGGKPLHPLQE
jgi:murein DD-endopeptidase MepM/ murein hydrolase activator NlpD/Rod binding domain-containing protein